MDFGQRQVDDYAWKVKAVSEFKKSLTSPNPSSAMYELLAEQAGRDRSALESQVVRIVMHLLKIQYQPQRRGRSWYQSVWSGQAELSDMLQRMPSLKNFLVDTLASQDIYEKALRMAVKETGLSRAHFPQSNPYTYEDVTSRDPDSFESQVSE
ncbi:MAG: DUF29 domain-containing protein [Luteolibacter sp.]